MTTFWWVRHGPTHEKAFVGWRDVPADLSDTGAIQRLKGFLPSDAVIISSDLIRCINTADAIQGNRHRLPHNSDLREFHFGDWDGRGFKEVADKYPDLSREYWERPGHAAPPGGESWFEAEERVEKAVRILQAEYPSQNVIVVAHFGVILSQLRRALDVPPADVLAQKIDNLSVTRITADGEHGPVNHCP